ncbi:EthD domain-containing protein [Sphingosinicella soli]|uniref:EthD domain-containing protein n=1 Tax=Sphingosinicella soli TaxID=333708 RepID=A0A7W7F782_9SPHN|nr:EthD domain-containing protein [Sphingosinicella soli]MBB4633380.1 hypothetical protein [Sphingosinicella soli]
MAGVKVFVGLPRKADVSEQHFHDHWRHPHATWGLEIGGRKHYVQSHRIDTPHLDVSQRRFDGVAEIWFDSAAEAGGYSQDPVYKGKLAPDEPSFLDMRNVRFLVADEEVLMSGPLAQNGGQPDDLGWREQNRPVTTKLLQFFDPATEWAGEDDLALGVALGAFRHVRCRPNPFVHARGCFVSGVRELWWPTLSGFERGVGSSPEAWRQLLSAKTVATMLATAERHL